MAFWVHSRTQQVEALHWRPEPVSALVADFEEMPFALHRSDCGLHKLFRHGSKARTDNYLGLARPLLRDMSSNAMCLLEQIGLNNWGFISIGSLSLHTALQQSNQQSQHEEGARFDVPTNQADTACFRAWPSLTCRAYLQDGRLQASIMRLPGLCSALSSIFEVCCHQSPDQLLFFNTAGRSQLCLHFQVRGLQLLLCPAHDVEIILLV